PGGGYRAAARLHAVVVAAARAIHAFRNVGVHAVIGTLKGAFRPAGGARSSAHDASSHRRRRIGARYAGVDGRTARRTTEALAALVDLKRQLERGGIEPVAIDDPLTRSRRVAGGAVTVRREHARENLLTSRIALARVYLAQTPSARANPPLDTGTNQLD